MENSPCPQQQQQQECGGGKLDKNLVTCDLLMSVVDEACFMMRSLNLILGENLEIPEKLKSACEAEIADAFEGHNKCLSMFRVASGSDALEEEIELSLSTWRLCRVLSQHKAFMKEVIFGMEKPSIALSFFQQTLQKFQTVVLKRLTTSLEEESAIEAYRTEVCHREERALKDHASLEEQLQIGRNAREKSLTQHQENERHLQQEMQQVKDQALSLQQELQNDFDALEEQESKSFSDQEIKFSMEVDQLKIHLEKLQASHKVVDEKVKFYQAYYEEREHEERKKMEVERLLMEMSLKEATKREEATLIIQHAWHKHHAKKLEEETRRKEQTQKKKGKSKSSKGKKIAKGK
ncbi:hypothetical protein O6H91_09G103900 [Diphasiastrum complanatum]|uniref:Uncharacterized protein n=1 Tax=Diphasiastrum complanatum TaxID=34168 RepID=A0ACC2CSM3_DIPCM|nr:hypothetical protein O6H91_09G103900 [Diphasiastrum complanatum]